MLQLNQRFLSKTWLDKNRSVRLLTKILFGVEVDATFFRAENVMLRCSRDFGE